jgi:hypothetical protein
MYLAAVRMVPIQTPAGAFKVWTKRIGNNPALRVLLLHAGPGATHEYLEACDSYLPAADVEYYYYDQLGSAYSDQPDDDSLWELDRFVDRGGRAVAQAGLRTGAVRGLEARRARAGRRSARLVRDRGRRSCRRSG